jgi:hypothetical protein
MRRRWLLVVWLAGSVVVGIASAALPQSAQLGAAAPEVSGGPWINSEPRTLTGLRGQVVLVEFWTYG